MGRGPGGWLGSREFGRRCAPGLPPTVWLCGDSAGLRLAPGGLGDLSVLGAVSGPERGAARPALPIVLAPLRTVRPPAPDTNQWVGTLPGLGSSH